ncbi:MAG: hypothetical protein NT027_18610 [Proteobacteria bacterium]|nr:hypothetical protein [Pseudomonadota bacterium]
MNISFGVSKQSGMIMFSLFLIAGNFSCKQANSFSGSSPNAPKKQKESVAVPTKSITPTPKASPTATLTPIASNSPLPSPKPTVIPNAIVKGSFTVWADPSAPKEDEDYQIHVRVKLPPGTISYNRNDLSGTLVGTDGYSQRINDPDEQDQTFSFVPTAGYAELVMWIPGTYKGVDDTLRVTSRLISESQVIIVHFN